MVKRKEATSAKTIHDKDPKKMMVENKGIGKKHNIGNV